MNKSICYIVSHGHSGSTLLGNIIGSHQEAIHIGELVAPIIKNRPIMCRDCLDEPCPIWGGIIAQNDLLDEYTFFKKSHKSYLPSVILKNRRGDIYTKLFSSYHGLKVIVDSSKNFDWYRFQSKNKRFEHKFIYLKRNPVAIIASLKRRLGGDIGSLIARYNTQADGIKSFVSKTDSKNIIEVSYEQIVLSFKSEVQRICDFLHLEFQENMQQFNEVKHHLIGGNQANILQKKPEKADLMAKLVGYDPKLNDVLYYSKFQGLKLDDRWKNELSEQEIKFIKHKIH